MIHNIIKCVGLSLKIQKESMTNIFYVVILFVRMHQTFQEIAVSIVVEACGTLLSNVTTRKNVLTEQMKRIVEKGTQQTALLVHIMGQKYQYPKSVTASTIVHLGMTKMGRVITHQDCSVRTGLEM